MSGALDGNEPPVSRKGFFELDRREWGIAVALLCLTVTVLVYGAVIFKADVTTPHQPTPGQGVLPGYGPPTFDLEPCLIPRDEIFSGGPPKDGIPAITSPKLVTADEASYLKGVDRVVGVVRGESARAYPIRILNWHEAVNDVLGDEPITVTYCPLCDSVVVFDRTVDGETLEFGISGLLYNSNVLLFDRRPDGKGESLWSQLQMRAVTGPAADQGSTLRMLPCDLTTWGAWRKRHPDTTVLSEDTGHGRNYGATAYGPYFSHDNLMFPVNPEPDPSVELRNKDKLVVVRAGGDMWAYPVDVLAKQASGTAGLEQTIGSHKYRLTYQQGADSVRVEPIGGSNDDLSLVYTFWFAWSAMHPDAILFNPQPTP